MLSSSKPGNFLPEDLASLNPWARRLLLLRILLITVIRPVITLMAMIAGSQLFGIWGAIFGAPTAGLIQALVGSYWQYYKKTHVEELPAEAATK